jgi:hypothetical protein
VLVLVLGEELAQSLVQVLEVVSELLMVLGLECMWGAETAWEWAQVMELGWERELAAKLAEGLVEGLAMEWVCKLAMEMEQELVLELALELGVVKALE